MGQTKTTKAVWQQRAEHWRRLAFLALDRVEQFSPEARAEFVATHFDATEDDGPTLDEAEAVIRELLHNMGGGWTEQCVRSEQQAVDAAGEFLMKMDRRAA